MSTQTEGLIKDRHLLIAILVVLCLSFVSQCGTSKKCSALQEQNEILTKKVDESSKAAISPEQLKFALQETMYQQLTIQEQVNKGKITAEQMQKNLSEIKHNLSEIKKTSDHEGTR